MRVLGGCSNTHHGSNSNSTWMHYTQQQQQQSGDLIEALVIWVGVVMCICHILLLLIVVAPLHETGVLRMDLCPTPKQPISRLALVLLLLLPMLCPQQQQQQQE